MGVLQRLGRALREFQGVTPEGQIPPRGQSRQGSVLVNEDTALRHSAVWACLRLRADLMSSFTPGVYRKVNGIPVDWPLAPILVDTGGEEWPFDHWMWASQHSLDLAGNSIGIITQTNALGLPARIELQPIRSCTVFQKKDENFARYKVNGIEVDRSKIWHERQFPVPGIPVGLSPLAFAAWSIGEYMSEQQFALDWFGGGGVPKASMKNKARTLKQSEITQAKNWYRDVIQNGELLVYGNDWEYDMIQGMDAGMAWLEARKYGLADVCRFFGCPADLIDAAVSSGGAITYQSTTQRNLQFLIMNMHPAVRWRQNALTKLLPQPRYVELDTSGLLELDPVARAMLEKTRIDSRTLTVTDARAGYGEGPLTAAEEAEFIRLFGVPAVKQTPEKVASQDRPAAARAFVMDTMEDWLAGTAPRSPAPIGARP